MGEPVIPGGAILIARKLNDSAIFEKPPLYLKIWMFLLTQAQHSDYKGLKRGQLFTSIPKIQKAVSWKIGYRTETPTKDQVFNVLEWLRKPRESNRESNRSTPMITTTKATQGMLITICNYNVYQTMSNYESNNEYTNEVDTNPLRKQRQADNINKNVYKNDKNDIYISSSKEKKSLKNPYGEFKNVLLSDQELEKLKERFAYDWKDRIDKLSYYIESKGKKYKSHYATILSWARKEEQENQVPKRQLTNTQISNKKEIDDLGWDD